MKTHMFRANLLDDPVVQPAESIRVPRFPSTRRWEQIRIRRVFFMLLYKKLYCICWEQHCSDGIWRFGVLMTSFPFCRATLLLVDNVQF